MTLSDGKVEADPVLVEIVAGTLAAIEKEVETSIGRTSRSPMIRDAHDFRAGIHDRKLRKLTGRSYSALVQPVVRDYPIDVSTSLSIAASVPATISTRTGSASTFCSGEAVTGRSPSSAAGCRRCPR